MLTLTVFIIHKPLTLDCESRAVNDNHRDRSSSLLLLLVFCLTKSHRSSTWRWRATRSSNWTRIGYGGYKDFKSYFLPKENWKATKSACPQRYCQPNPRNVNKTPRSKPVLVLFQESIIVGKVNCRFLEFLTVTGTSISNIPSVMLWSTLGFVQ